MSNGMRPAPLQTENAAPIPAWWRGTAAEIEAALVSTAKVGRVTVLCDSPGNRPVRAVSYGEPEIHLRGTANFNSAIGAKRPEAYFDRPSRRDPVLLVLAGVHGQEMEGMVAAMSLLHILETGRDVRGREVPRLAESLRQLRIIIVPLANPDGRERVPYRGWVGLSVEEMTRWGQGTRKNGESYGYEGCKAVHPMTDDVGILGGYFDDAGVNLMHDDWSSPMSDTTRALLRLVAREGPDLLLNLHSYASPPGIYDTAFTPVAHTRRTEAFVKAYQRRLAADGLRYKPWPHPSDSFEPSFNLQSMFYHVGCAWCLMYESPHGVAPLSLDFGYDEILDSHHILFELSARTLLAQSNVRHDVRGDDETDGDTT